MIVKLYKEDDQFYAEIDDGVSICVIGEGKTKEAAIDDLRARVNVEITQLEADLKELKSVDYDNADFE